MDLVRQVQELSACFKRPLYIGASTQGGFFFLRRPPAGTRAGFLKVDARGIVRSPQRTLGRWSR